jgi:hypothetical protein
MKESTPIPRARNEFPVKTAAIALLGLMAALMVSSAWDDTLTNDEAAHIGAGYSYLERADYRMNPEHPPLIKDLASLPLLAMGLQPDWNHKSWSEDPFGQWDFGQRLVFNSGRDPDAVTRAAKAPMIVFTVALGALLFAWTRKQFGNAVALLALFFYAFSPTFLAHGRLVTTDVGAAAGFFVGTTGFLRYLNNPTRRSMVLAGLAMGFAFLTKFSTVALIPIALLLAVAWALAGKAGEVGEVPARRGFFRFRKGKGASFAVAFRAPSRVSALCTWLARTAGVIAIAYLVIYPLYLHHTWNYPPERQRTDTISRLEGHGVGHTPKNIVIWASDKPVVRPWAEYFSGLFQNIQRSAAGNNPFFLGRIQETGSPLYFPFVYLVKEPLALHALTVFALVSALVFAFSRIRGRASPEAGRERLRPWLAEHFVEFAFLVVIAVYWGMAVTSNLNVGVRHLLPTFPFVFILVANGVTGLHRRLAGKAPALWAFRITLGALLAWQAMTVIRVHPSYLAYFNELAGGPENGWRYVSDSNVDWGQDLKRLAKFVDQQGIQEIHLDYFGGADPAYYLQEKYRSISGCSEPQKGWVAVSAFMYQGWRAKPECDYRRWLPMDKLVTKIGYAIFVFRIE